MKGRELQEEDVEEQVSGLYSDPTVKLTRLADVSSQGDVSPHIPYPREADLYL